MGLTENAHVCLCVPLSEIAAWLAESGPVSAALNAFAMQVRLHLLYSLGDTYRTLKRIKG